MFALWVCIFIYLVGESPNIHNMCGAHALAKSSRWELFVVSKRRPRKLLVNTESTKGKNRTKSMSKKVVKSTKK